MLSAGLIAAVMAACPDEARVAEGLARAAPAEVRAKYRWSVAVEGESMRVVLLDARGAVVRERVVPAPAKCAERETVAVAVLGAWIVTAPVAVEPLVEKKKPEVRAPSPPAGERAGVRGESSAVVDVSPREPETPPIEPAPAPSPPPDIPLTPSLSPTRGEGAPAAPPGPPASVASPDTGAVSPEPSPGAGAPEATATLEPPPPAEPDPLRLELALDTRAQYAGAFAPGFGLTASFGARLSGFLELSTALARKIPLGPGDVLWLRIAAGAGVRYRFDLRYLYVEPAFSVEGAFLRAEGIGFQRNSVAEGFDLSVCAQTRAGHVFNDAIGIFVGVRGCAWPMQSRVRVISIPETAPFPTFELAALLGISGGYSFVKGPSQTRPSEK